MDNQHKLIAGYRDLSAQEIAAMNMIKKVAQEVEGALQDVEQLLGVDKRWLAIARTDLQKGFMAAVRSIAQPTTF